MDPTQDPPRDIAERIQLEAERIKPDDPWYRAITNWWNRKQWPKDDPRRGAAAKAFRWRLVCPQTLALVGSGAIAILTLFMLYRESRMTRDQFNQTTARLDRQDARLERQRRSELLEILYTTIPNPNRRSTEPSDAESDENEYPPWYKTADRIPKYNPRARQDALVEYLALERNATREYQRGERPELLPFFTGAIDLAYAQLQGVYLRHTTDLRGVLLVGADFSGARAWGFRFNGSYPEQAVFRDADLRGANFQVTNLTSGMLVNADLRQANLEGADLCSADFTRARLEEATLSGAGLCEADLRYAILVQSHLTRADLADAKFHNADLFEADLRHATNWTPEQLMQAQNWEYAIYDEGQRAALGLTPLQTQPTSQPTTQPAMQPASQPTTQSTAK